MSTVYKELSSYNKYLFNKCVDYYNSVEVVENAIRNKSKYECKKIMENLIRKYKARQTFLRSM